MTYGNVPIIPEEGVLCDIQHCDKDATRSWYTEVTDRLGLPIRSMLINYCRTHEPPENTMGARNTMDERIESVEYAIQERVGNGPWERTDEPISWDEEQALKTLAEVRNSHYNLLKRIFDDIKTPAQARAAADEYERLQETEYRIVKRTIIDEKILKHH